MLPNILVMGSIKTMRCNIRRSVESMAYVHHPHPDNTKDVGNFIRDLLHRREFRFAPSALPLHDGQKNIAAFASPVTPYSRQVAEWDAGTGKSRLVLAAVNNFRRWAPSGNIIVLGFMPTRVALMNEAMINPEFGFVTPAEAEVAKSSDGAGRATIRSHVARAMRKYGFIMMGYQEFINRTVRVTQRGKKEGVNVKQLLRTGAATGKGTKGKRSTRGPDDMRSTRGPDDMSGIDLQRALDNKFISIDVGMKARFSGSFVFCDEIHNAFNAVSENNYGALLRIALDSVEESPYTPARFLGLSATLATTSAAERVDVLNLLITPAQRKSMGVTFFRRRDFFSPDGKLKRGAEMKIAELYAGRSSFMRRKGAFARREFIGNRVNGFPFPLVVCDLPPLQQKAIDAAQSDYKLNIVNIADLGVFDMIFPRPPSTDKSIGGQTDTGLYGKSSMIHATLLTSTPEWKAKMGVRIPDVTSPLTPIVTGPFLRLSDSGTGTKIVKGIDAYSAKYSSIVKMAIKNLRGKKIVVYTPRVSGGGALVLAEVFRTAGFINTGDAPGNNTLCSMCGKTLSEHRAQDAPNGGGTPSHHKFSPATLSVLTGMVPKSEAERLIADLNSPANDHGEKITLLIGTRVINEGYNLLSVRLLLVAGLPDSISMLIQVLGRVMRRGGHERLPGTERCVDVAIFISKGLELEKAFAKAVDYDDIQKLDSSVKSLAIPASADDFNDMDAQRRNLGGLNNSTFNAFGYSEELVAIGVRRAKEFVKKQGWMRVSDLKDILDPLHPTPGEISLIARKICRAQNQWNVNGESPAIWAGDMWVHVPPGVPAAMDVFCRPQIQVIGSKTLGSGGIHRIPLENLDDGGNREREYQRRLGKYRDRFGSSAQHAQMACLHFPPEFHYRTARSMIDGTMKMDNTMLLLLAAYNQLGIVSTIVDRKDKHSAVVERDSVDIFMPARGWVKVSRSIVPQRPRQENDVIVGFFGVSNDGFSQVYKIREPLHRSVRTADARELSRGGACVTRPRAYIIEKAKKIGVKGDVDSLSNAHICEGMRSSMLAKEISGRDKNGERWIYIFNEIQPT